MQSGIPDWRIRYKGAVGLSARDSTIWDAGEPSSRPMPLIPGIDAFPPTSIQPKKAP